MARLRPNPELLRRAMNLAEGRTTQVRRFRCRTLRHRLWVRLLAREGVPKLRRRLERLQVRLDPPDFARECSCEVGS